MATTTDSDIYNDCSYQFNIGETGFGDYAVGGANQIYLPDPSVAK